MNEQSLGEAVAGRRFDVVFCGELIEHVFSPDALLDDLRSVLAGDGLLVLSTPNLGYWVNRILLVAGISPMFLENSATVKLGRRFKALGNGNPTQGHLRVFTYRAMKELLDLRGFALARTQGVTGLVVSGRPARVPAVAGAVSRRRLPGQTQAAARGGRRAQRGSRFGGVLSRRACRALRGNRSSRCAWRCGRVRSRAQPGAPRLSRC